MNRTIIELTVYQNIGLIFYLLFEFWSHAVYNNDVHYFGFTIMDSLFYVGFYIFISLLRTEGSRLYYFNFLLQIACAFLFIQ